MNYFHPHTYHMQVTKGFNRRFCIQHLIIVQMCDVKKYFGDLNGKNVVEIGVGYGGLCFVLSSFYNINSYELVDLENCVFQSSQNMRTVI